MCTDGGVQVTAGLYVKNNYSSRHIYGQEWGRNVAASPTLCMSHGRINLSRNWNLSSLHCPPASWLLLPALQALASYSCSCLKITSGPLGLLVRICLLVSEFVIV